MSKRPARWVVAGAAGMAVALVVTVRPALLAQSADAMKSTAAIAGRIVDGSTGAPVGGATVTLSHRPSTPTLPSPAAATVEKPRFPVNIGTGADGRFAFNDLPGGRFDVVAVADGYRRAYFGMQTAADSYGSNADITIAAGERLSDVVVRMWKAASISGLVTDERGEPLVKAPVQLLAREYMPGGVVWAAYFGPRRTDDRGAFRFVDLSPGDYLVALPGQRNAEVPIGYDSTFFSGSMQASTATVITVGPGESRTGINLSAATSPVTSAVSVAGRVTGGNGFPLAGLVIRIVRADAEDALIDLESQTALVDAKGAFRFPRVAPGDYRLLSVALPPRRGLVSLGMYGFNGYAMASPSRTEPIPTPEGTTWVVDRRLTVDRPIDDLDVPLQEGARIRGRVVFEGSPPPSRASTATIPILVLPARIRPLGAVPLGGFDADGRFQTVGLPPGPYVIAPSHGSRDSDMSDWWLHSIRVAGRETIGQPIELGTTDVTDVELVLSKQHTGLSGSVRAADGTPVSWGRILIFPRDRESWNDYAASPAPRRIRQIVADRSGAFDGAGVPPGEYRLVALRSAPEFWMAPEFLSTLEASAVPVTLRLGEAPVVTLTVKP